MVKESAKMLHESLRLLHLRMVLSQWPISCTPQEELRHLRRFCLTMAHDSF